MSLAWFSNIQVKSGQDISAKICPPQIYKVLNDDKVEDCAKEIISVLDLLDRYGAKARPLRFQEIDIQTRINRGLLRNILNHLKKTREVETIYGDNGRILYVLKKHHRRCLIAESKSKDTASRVKNKSHVRVQGRPISRKTRARPTQVHRRA